MFNAISKPVTTVALSMLLLCSCGNSDKEGASQLFTQTEEAIQNRNYTGALTLLDTLNARYPKQLDIRKAALRLRASAMEGIAIDSIGAGDMALAQATIEVDVSGHNSVTSKARLDSKVTSYPTKFRKK